MTRAKRLRALQAIDSQRDEIRARLAKVMRALRGSPAVARARAEVEAAEAELGKVEPDLRRESLERQTVKEHLQREEGALYGGKVRAPKELQNLKRETDALRRNLTALDDRVLELMVARDDAVGRLERARADLERAVAESAAQSSKLQAEQLRLNKALGDLDARREHAIAGVPPSDQQVYDRLRKTMGGKAVADLRTDTCGICGMQLARHEADRVIDSDQLVFCPGCSRILVG